MVYRAIGLMSGSSLDGLDIAFVEFNVQGKKWEYNILHADCYAYSADWRHRLEHASGLNAREYLLLHSDYGHYLGQQVNQFIHANDLQYKVALVASHGHTVFHMPSAKMTSQLGDGASLAAETGLPVITDLRALDVALGGQGAPIVPIGERLLLEDHDVFLNIGGIANISINRDPYLAFDVCPANRVLNLLAMDAGKSFDENGMLAASGHLHQPLLAQLDALDYYRQAAPKSLANDFGTGIVYPLIKASGCSVPDALHTYVHHIAGQVALAIQHSVGKTGPQRLLATGGGALNRFLISTLEEKLQRQDVTVVVPDPQLVNYKEALIMAFIGVLRWRQEYNVLSSVTGAARDSVGGALWMGQS